MVNPILKIAFKVLPISPLNTTIALLLAVSEFTPKCVTLARPCFSSRSMLGVLLPITLVSVSLLVCEYTFTIGAVILPKPIITLARGVDHASKSALLTLDPFTFINTTVFKDHHTKAIWCVR
jgi:hypothetical protein